MPADAKLCWITRNGASIIEAPEPVERRRCVMPGHLNAERLPDIDQCWVYSWQFGNGEAGVHGPCRFVTVYEVPAPSHPEPPDEATT